MPTKSANSRSLARRLVSATMVGAFVQAAGLALSFIVGVQLARHLEPSGYGTYGTVMAIVALLLVPAQLGLPQLATRELAARIASGEPAIAKGALIAFTGMVLAASFTVTALTAAGLWSWSASTETSIARHVLPGLLLVPLYAITSLASSIMRGLERVVTAQLFELICRPLFFAGLLYLWVSTAHALDASEALVLHVLASAVTLLVTGAVLWRSPLRRLIGAEAAIYSARNWFRAAGPMATTELVRSIDGNAIVLLLGLVVALDQVGLFRVASAAAALAVLPYSMMALLVMPFVARLRTERDQQRLQALVAGAAAFTFFGAGAVTACFLVFGEELISTIFGPEYVSAWPTLVLISIAFTITAFFGVGPSLLNMSGFERVVARAYAIALAIGLPLSFLLAWLLGIVGVGLALIVSETVKALIIRRVARTALGIDSTILAALSLNAGLLRWQRPPGRM